MPGPLGPSSNFVYVSDDGNTYAVRLNDAKAAVAGFTPTPDKGNYPRAWRMRHVWAEQADGTRVSVPIDVSGNSLFVTGGTFTLHGASYTVQGSIGEKRPNK